MSQRITSRQNPIAVHVRKLGRDRPFRREQGQFLCEGRKLVEEALKWGAKVELWMIEEGVSLPFQPPDGAQVLEVPGDLLRFVSTVESPQGVLAVCAIPKPPSPAGGRWLVLDGLQDPGNLGTIWRTADAFGADGLFLVNSCADPWSPKTVRATMGACFRLPVWDLGMEELAGLLHERDIPLYAAALEEDTADVRDLDLRRAAVIIGSEGRGVSRQGLDLCEKTVKIPMTGRCESLNAAMAATVVLWEMFRERGR